MRNPESPQITTLNLLRASPIAYQIPPILKINIVDEIQEMNIHECAQTHINQGTALADNLLRSLPGGTVDILISELMRRRASLFSISLNTYRQRAHHLDRDLNPNDYRN